MVSRAHRSQKKGNLNVRGYYTGGVGSPAVVKRKVYKAKGSRNPLW